MFPVYGHRNRRDLPIRSIVLDDGASLRVNVDVRALLIFL